MKLRQTTFFVFPAFALCSLAQGQEQAEPTQAAVVASKEYFVQQQAHEAIVVRVEAFEAEFVSRLTTTEGEVLAESGLPDARMLPLYQFVTQPRAPRQVDIDVTATQVTNRSEFGLELIRLNVRDERSAGLASAYRLLSVGLESAQGGNVPNWTVKVQTLLQAATLFAEMGMEEMRLWCRVYAAHLVLHRIRDAQTALDWAGELLASPRIERFDAIAFAASKIRSTALAATGPGPRSDDPATSPVQRALEETALRARALAYRYEEAVALQASAVDLKARGQPAPALERLDRALAIAADIGAGDLAAAVREHIVEVHNEFGGEFGGEFGEEFGDLQATGDVLQDIESHLLETGENEELARNLLQQGRLLLTNHRYPEAAGVLSRAAGLEQSALTRIEVELALGSALNESGRFNEALLHLQRATIQPDTGEFRKPGPALDFFSALGAMTAIHRQQGDFERTEQIRAVQQDYSRSAGERAEWAYQRAVDALMAYGPSSGITLDRFSRAYGQGDGSTENPWHQLTLLRLCALPAMLGGVDPRCGEDRLGKAFEDVRSAGDQRPAAEAAMLYAYLLGLRGRGAEALAVAEAQVETLLNSGPKPLGAWYWQWRRPLFENYLGLAIAAEGRTGDASSSLLALARARAVERGGAAIAPSLNEAGLDAFLESLPRESAVLSYFLTESAAQAWVARSSSIRRISLDDPAEILSLCEDMRVAIQAGDWAGFDSLAVQLGPRLLGPVATLLPATVFLVSHGPLLGLPIDALQLDGEPAAGKLRIVHLDAFPAAADPAERLRFDRPARVFLAGDPRDWSGDYASHLDPSMEVGAVTEMFVGPGLHAVVGVALLRDEFDDERYSTASLVHLSIPGIVDLSPARESILFLSEPGRGEGRQRLGATALQGMPLGAGLLFLSRTEFMRSGTLLESDVGLVSSALRAGAGAVIAGLWAVDDQTRSRFAAGFYAHLAKHHDVAKALYLAKRDAMRAGEGRNLAGFQLFLN